MVSEDKKNVKEVGRSLLNPPPPLPPPTKLKLVPSLSVKDKKNEVETSIFDCDTSKPCISFKCSEKKVPKKPTIKLILLTFLFLAKS